MRFSVFALFVLMAALLVLVQCAPLDSDPTNPEKSEDWISPSDPNGIGLIKKKLLLKKLVLLG
ncbi:Transcription factor ste11 [Frankliniella fusca]|uniref:Transcription factor ste11 n=1 Tax=Frankliniella fusca TaxID=407009 RepID=A0AAE1H7T9_9NEOP|nr:Transcription factor ste11 [Frankliniella fusca]